MRLYAIALIACLLYFLAAGLIILPYPGIAHDEALFASAIYAPGTMEAKVSVFGTQIPIMMMSYLGTLKAGCYALLFAVWKPSLWSLRVPMLLVGAATILVFAALLMQIAGRRAALFGALLLATDTVFLLTTTMDWGPTALQHVLLVGALFLLVRYHRERRLPNLGAATFLLGLAVWNKAIFLWILAGLTLASVVLRREVREIMTLRTIGVAAAGLLLGASPFLWYAVPNPGKVTGGTEYSFADFKQNVAALQQTLRGDILTGTLVSVHPTGDERRSMHPSLWLSDLAHRRITGGLLWLALPALITGLFLARKAVLFFLIAAGVAWCQMLLAQQAGGSAHHTVMLTPLLIGAIAIGAAAFPFRVIIPFVLAVALVNVLVTNEHLARLIRFGPEPMWTDATGPLSKHVGQTGASRVYVADWGIGPPLRLMMAGDASVANAIEPFNRQQMDPEEQRRLLERLGERDALFIGHVEGRRYFPTATQLLLETAEQQGFEQMSEAVIPDSHGRDVFEVYRFHR